MSTYKWLKDYMEAGKSRLKGDILREANKGEVDALKRENERLKELVAQLKAYLPGQLVASLHGLQNPPPRRQSSPGLRTSSIAGPVLLDSKWPILREPCARRPDNE